MRNQGTERLVCLRNPWGPSNEWNGAWSDKSDLWDQISDDQIDKSKMDDGDGLFWMSINDFFGIFEKVSICHYAVR